MSSEVMVRISRVSKTYGRRDNRVAALDDVSVAFPGGRFTAVMGPSGSGKSTLLQCAAGIDRVDAGEVELAGTSLTGLSEGALTRLRRDRIGFVFQAFNLVPSLTARQNVALPLMLAGKRPKRRDVDAALDRLGLAERRRHRPGEMSGGQQQRVAIARALVTRPRVLFADEPTGALDSRSSREVMTLLRDLVDREGQTIVMVTHDPVAASVADEVLFLADGRIAGSLEAPTPELVAARITGLEGAQ
ncbi:ABC transporter ATP-binding protein [Actinomadura nitritigenes]|uniref:ABC transporter ATP-binding protein n=1 Tax=Actinomadura nitritigenes TaxID=134602 RepID=UPI003D9313B1